VSKLDPRTPVIIGVGQMLHRPDDLTEAVESLEMMALTAEAAADDAGTRQALKRADAIRVIKGAWSYSDPARLLAKRWGADVTTGLTTDGGNTPQALVNRSALEISKGDHDIVVIVGAENIWSRRRARRNGLWIDTTEQTEDQPDEILGKSMVMNTPFELSRGLQQPVNVYPLFESAIRHSNGETHDEHRDRVSALWARFNDVAVDNPFAWTRSAMTADQIRNPSDTNRMVGYPYTKSMNSNWDLNQAAAVIMCSARTADALGVHRYNWVFPLSGTEGADTTAITERANLHSSPAIRVAGRQCLELAGIGPDDIDHVDLYSCFPSAVQIGAKELGLSLDRQLTVTGGLTFAGGPLNNYVTHSIATMVDVMRNDPNTIGLCSANGGYTTKHAFGLYSSAPLKGGFRHADCQAEIDTHPRSVGAEDHTGAVTIEAYTVMHGKAGPEQALMALEVEPGVRTWGNSTDQDLLAAMLKDEFIGRSGVLDGDGVVTAT
jgi:acetyl-CoA C-acetyltransferase